MSKKHFEAIASDLRWFVESGIHDVLTVKAIAEGLCDTFKQCNPLFSRSRFLEACGL